MSDIISVSLPEEIKSELDQAVREEGLTRSDFVRKALQDHLYIRRFRSLRSRMMPQAQASGFHVDEDVFEQVS